MHISDWSSDVCSSDLNDIVPVRLPGNLELVGEWGFSPGERFTLQPDTSRIFTWTVTVTGPGDGEISTEWYGKNIAEDNVGPVTDVLPFTVSTGLDVDLEMDLATATMRSEEHTSELQSLMRISYAVFCLKKKKKKT